MQRISFLYTQNHAALQNTVLHKPNQGKLQTIMFELNNHMPQLMCSCSFSLDPHYKILEGRLGRSY